uniref:Uncharacterized protein n=1 Tax=Oncorhynchus kisutch TaxID=8019 RepID=A0A8C7KB79_ONCKI
MEMLRRSSPRRSSVFAAEVMEVFDLSPTDKEYCMGKFVCKSLVSWLKRRGGWADITKCVVNTDPSFRSHWLMSAACACGHYLKAMVFYLLRDK